MSGVYGVLGSVAVAAGAAALMGPALAPADSVARAPLRVRDHALAQGAAGGDDGDREALHPSPGYPNAAAIPIKPWNLDVTVPRDPTVVAQPTCIDQLTTGMALAGGTFHLEVATDAEDRAVDPNAALPLDRCWGHPYETQYHYHGPSQTCFGKGAGRPERGAAGHSPLVGCAIDGFGIYGPRGEDGRIVRNKDLDVCHGHTHAIMWDGKKVVMYHYHLNGECPYSIGCFRGTPVTVPGSGHGWCHQWDRGSRPAAAGARRRR